MLFAIAALSVLTLLVCFLVRYCIVFPRQPFHGPLPQLSSHESPLATNLQAHIESFARTPRNMAYKDSLDRTADYIEKTLHKHGLTTHAQIFQTNGLDVRNIEVVFEPPAKTANATTIVVGAHYDSADDSPGANDNGTGVAALLELAKNLSDISPTTNRLRLVFFVNEEAPYGKTPQMGSWQHARRLKSENENVAGMIALETIGYFSNKPKSQAFPAPFGLIYADVGNFVAFVGLPGSRTFLHNALKKFRKKTQFPSIGGIAPGFLEGIDLSDHWVYHHFGFPALMITDTAPFRNPYYHQTYDLPHTVDYQSLARITSGLERMIRAIIK